jgi:hypothetical protein
LEGKVWLIVSDVLVHHGKNSSPHSGQRGRERENAYAIGLSPSFPFVSSGPPAYWLALPKFGGGGGSMLIPSGNALAVTHKCASLI